MVGEGLWDKKNLIDVHVVVPVPFVCKGRRKRKLLKNVIRPGAGV
jgi:hypothetical protein